MGGRRQRHVRQQFWIDVYFGRKTARRRPVPGELHLLPPPDPTVAPRPATPIEFSSGEDDAEHEG